jgi:hypothetical protein
LVRAFVAETTALTGIVENRWWIMGRMDLLQKILAALALLYTQAHIARQHDLLGYNLRLAV